MLKYNINTSVRNITQIISMQKYEKSMYKKEKHDKKLMKKLTFLIQSNKEIEKLQLKND